jgi:hypothetical protein
MADANRSVHPNTIPNYEKAFIPPEKLEKYALDPTHPIGRHKAIVFKSALGIDQSNWQLLAQAILNELPYYDAGKGTSGPWGTKYNVVLGISGPNGNSVDVMTVWIIKSDADYPSLVTCYVV